MTDETPEVPEEKAAKKATKKKTAARKRSAKPVAETPGEGADAQTPVSEPVAEVQTSVSASVAEDRPQKTEEPKAQESETEVRRISNKPGEEPVETVRTRKGGKPRKSEEGSSSEDSDAPPMIGEPPSSEEGGNKRRRRRRRKGGQGEDSEEQPPRAPRPKLDPEKVAKKAWNIYLAEVSEEGLALISDQDARELSRRSFRLAEVFLEEASRHH